MTKSPNYAVPALDRGLDILEALAELAVPQSLSDLAAQLDRSASSLFRVLNGLERRHYVTRDPLSGKYALSLRLFALAHTHSPVEALLRAARMPMQALATGLDESCHLSVLERGRVLVVAQQHSPSPVRVSIEVGGEFDPLLAASGRLLLAQLDDDLRGAVLDQSPAWQAAGPRRRREWQAAIGAIRRSGWSQGRDDTVEGLEDLATLVGGRGSPLQAALAVTRFHGSRAPAKATKVRRLLKEAAAAITENLGMNP